MRGRGTFNNYVIYEIEGGVTKSLYQNTEGGCLGDRVNIVDYDYGEGGLFKKLSKGRCLKLPEGGPSCIGGGLMYSE